MHGFVQVWLEAGREGQVFTYANPDRLVLGPGDLVAVRLQGRRHGGLVVETLVEVPAELQGRTLEPVLELLQPAAVDPRWRAWIAQVADQCHTSLFRTLKSALPAGWLGQRRKTPLSRPRWGLPPGPWHAAGSRCRQSSRLLLFPPPNGRAVCCRPWPRGEASCR